jgi:hypothetical protein
MLIKLEVHDSVFLVELRVVLAGEELAILVLVGAVVRLPFCILPQKFVMLPENLHICDGEPMCCRSFQLVIVVLWLLYWFRLLIQLRFLLQPCNYLFQWLYRGCFTHLKTNMGNDAELKLRVKSVSTIHRTHNKTLHRIRMF